MFVRSVFLAIAASPTTITAFEKREAGTTAGHATAGATDYTPEDRENDEGNNDYGDYDRPSMIRISKDGEGVGGLKGDELAI